MKSIIKHDSSTPPRLRTLQRNGLARRYLFSALLIALVPLGLLAIVYDTQYVRALDKVTESRTNARLSGAENLLRTFLQERIYELEGLADIPEVFEWLTTAQPGDTPDRVMLAQLRQQLDSPHIYGVVTKPARFDQPQWYLTQTLLEGVSWRTLPVTRFAGAELLGPALPTPDRPGWIILRLSPTGFDPAPEAWIGLVIRLASLTEQIQDLTLPGLQAPLIVPPQKVLLTSVGNLKPPGPGSKKDINSRAFIEGWHIRLQWLGDPLLGPLESARFGLIFLAMGVALGVIFLSRHLSKRLDRQVTPLIEGADRVASGDFDTPLGIEGTAEIGYLSFALERMRLRLKRLVKSMVDVERRAVLGQFSAGVAHEIRNPLATIKTTIQALSRKESDPKRQKLMESVDHEIDRVNDVVQLLLDYARPREAKAQKVNVLDVVETVKILADAVAHRHGVELVQVEHSQVFAWADPSQIRQIVMNLVMNAIQALEAIGGRVVIRVRQQGLAVYISVSDNGPGVSADHLSHLTEPFFTTKTNGTGLGLAICKQLAQANQGTLRFQSVPGEGLKVTLRLPLYLNNSNPE
ncbi:histidine kinase [Marinobacter salinus]|uniref:histidine kinase n=1 Tax=Marinobacter salinus TaxID=1874317 RepID=A0A1D9GNY5_9GAMM|nr:ATP-binding protein [Marinobacter salinus]AOY89110.1 histidine kinase [Marinobacter salinus]